MRKLKFMVGNSATVEIDGSFISEMRQGRFTALREFFSGVSFLAVLASLLLTLTVAVHAANEESTVLHHVLAFAAVMVAGWLVLTILCGWKFTIDPPLFVTVLVFALFSTLSYLLSPENPVEPGNADNTFGVAGVRAISALAVSAMIFSYYFFNVHINSMRRWQWANYAVLGGVASLTLLLVLAQNPTLVKLVTAQSSLAGNLMLLLVPFMVMWVVFARHVSKYVWWCLLLLLVTSMYFGFVFASGVLELLVVALVLFVSTMTIYVTRGDDFRSEFKQFRGSFSKLVARKGSVRELFQGSSFVSLVIFTILWVVLAVAIAAVEKFNFVAEVQAVAADFRLAFGSIEDAKTLFFGNGAVANRIGSTLADILAYQGVVGVLAYLVLGLSAIWYALNQVVTKLSNEKANDTHSLLALFTIILAVPLLATVAGLSVTLVWLWWAALAMFTSAKLIATKRSYDLLPISRLKNKGLSRVLPIGQLLLIVLVLLGAWAVINAVGALVVDKIG